jgi:hypothetical protein
MREAVFAVMLALTIGVLADEPAKQSDVDTEAYKAAVEKLKSKSVPAPAAQETDIEVLRAENAALRQRISELEAMLGIRAKAGTPRQTKNFTTFQDMVNTIKPPADPHKEWSSLQKEKAQHDISASVVGCTFKASMRLDRASHGAGGFTCSFSRAGANGQEWLNCQFDSRYSDLITSWKVGQSIAFTGTISALSIEQDSKAPGGLKLHNVRLSDCVPN